MGKELYVRHISEKATGEDLRRFFSVCGTVTSVHLVTDPDTGRFMGCGFVRMATEAEARDAIETLDNALLVDRTILVNEARPLKPSMGKPSGNRRGGFGKGGPSGRAPGSGTGRTPGRPAGGRPAGNSSRRGKK